jgi:dihydropteroate synthase
MGILNITPDSFYDGGRYSTEKQWIVQVTRMLEEGASIIDIGAASTRPGAREIAVNEEAERIAAAVTSIRKQFGEIVLSVDTYRSEVARIALDLGVQIVNDISGGTFDPGMITLAARYDAMFVVMHTGGRPDNMQDNPDYSDVVHEVKKFLTRQVFAFSRLNHRNLILDPGFGFGKTLSHNYQLLNSLERFAEMGFPLMVGFSRKSMIYRLLGNGPEAALNGTSVLNTIALLKGAQILRVHDVKEAVETIRLVKALQDANH